MNRVIAIAAGGTGGHVFPAQALSSELGARGIATLILTDDRGAQYKSGYSEVTHHVISAGTPTSKGMIGKVMSVFPIMMGIIQAFGILRKAKPMALAGFGGYSAFPSIIAARLLRIPVCIHEQNAVFGRGNRSVTPFVQKIALSFQEVSLMSPAAKAKSVVTGNPVRTELAALHTQTYHVPRTGSAAAAEVLHLFIFGGSQGARAISDLVPAALAGLPKGFRTRLNVMQQSRPEDIDRVRDVYANAGIKADVEAFFDDMAVRLARTHLVIARSGASTVAELAISGRPSILIPLPGAVDGDQAANAEFLVNAGAACLMTEADATPEKLAAKISELIEQPELLVGASFKARAIARVNAAADLADLVEGMARSEAPNAEAQEAADESRPFDRSANKMSVSETGTT